jgi:hypothetical protein
MTVKPAHLLAFSLLVGSVCQASVFLVTSSAGLGGNDSTDWASLGAVDSLHASPLSALTVGGRPFTATTTGGDWQHYIQDGVDWDGNFANGAALLYSAGAPITFSFASPIVGAGMQIQPNDGLVGAFTARIEAFDAGDTSLGAFTETGFGSHAADGSAIFIGIRSDTANIAKFTVSFTDTLNSEYNFMAISNISISAVPEPAIAPALTAVGLLGLAACRRRATRS